MKSFQKVSIAVLLLFEILVIYVMLSELGHGSVAKNNRANSLGVLQVYTNPNVYLFASISEGTIIRGKNDSELFTNIRFQPYHTMSLYNETILFCGNQSEKFNGKTGAILVTYEKVAHRMFKSIPCHELESVFEVPTPKERE